MNRPVLVVVFLGVVCSLSGVCYRVHSLSGGESNPSGYTPVAPPAATSKALRSSLQAVQDWVEQGDFVSAADTSGELQVLVRLYRYHSNTDTWGEKMVRLEEAARQVQAATRKEDRAGAVKAIANFSKQLDEVGKTPPPGPKVVEGNFRPTGSLKTWMLILDAAYGESKRTRAPEEIELLAGAIAEEANAVRFLRTDARWRKTAEEVRDLALSAADKARTEGVDAARAELKRANQRCEFCHQGFKR